MLSAEPALQELTAHLSESFIGAARLAWFVAVLRQIRAILWRTTDNGAKKVAPFCNLRHNCATYRTNCAKPCLL